ncbi:DUF2269 domain-containing protein [Actinoplanes utahensis]|nr:DUF2269 domain-containing protein [Actinoplanes utahensis]GIF34090.1 hypothetical protein Aut01nite_70760 [Actinoplanes utahensis]
MVHIAVSVGWLGAVAASLALAGFAVAAEDPRSVSAAYVVLEPLGWLLLVPLSIASLFTGVAQSLITVWGLVRHYWVLIKLLLNVLAVAVLLLYMQTLGALADTALAMTAGGSQIVPGFSPVIHTVGAMALLFVALALSVYKPRGLTPAGYRNRRAVPGSRVAR